MKNILLIATGGTISCNNTEENRAPTLDGERILELFGNNKHVDVLNLMHIDSSEMLLCHRLLISDAISKNEHKYDAFIILHGTDTMCYTSSLLNYLLADIKKPIILTGSQNPIEDENTDAYTNLETAFCMAETNFSGVCIAWQNEILDGACATKISTEGFFTMKSIYPNIGVYESGRISLNTLQNYHKHSVKNSDYNTNFAIIKLFPDFNGKYLSAFTECYAVILEAFGSGGFPEHLFEHIKKLTENGVKVFVKSQAVFGGVDLKTYESSAKALKLSVIDTGKDTIENICAKIICNIY